MSTENGVAGVPVHMHGFALTHLAMRRDARRIAKAAPNVTRANAGSVATWFDEVLNVIDWHHRTEDEVLFPELRRRVPEFEAMLEQGLAHDHHALDQAMADVARSLRGDLDALPEAASRMENVLLEHLKAEEPIVFPVFMELTPRQYQGLEEQVLRSAGPGMRVFLFPWLFDGLDRRTAARSASALSIPAPIRLIGNTVLTWRYDRMIAPVVNLGRR